MCVLCVVLAGAPGAQAQLGKGYQILLNRGLQLQGLVQWDDFFHLDTYSNANYTSVNWGWTCKPSLMGTAPGVPWSRWVSGLTNMPPQATQGDEEPYLPQLFSLQLGDEWNLQDGQTRTNLINWFNTVRADWPNTILFHNNYGGQASDAALADFIPKARPDMLSFDVYPFMAVWDLNAPNHIGAPLSGPFTGWYSELRRYRQWAMNYGIPFAAYLQTFHAVQDYDQHVYRNPSPSELRLNTSVALAFNATGDRLYSGGMDNAREWNVATGRLLATYGERAVPVLALSADGRLLIGGDLIVHLWEVRSARLLADLTGHKDLLRSIAVSPNGKMIATASDDGTIRVWGIVTDSEGQ